MRTGNERAHGPYKHGKRWRVIYVGANGEREVVSFATWGEADGEIREAQRQAGGRSVEMAVAAFLDGQREGVRASTLVTNGHRLRAFMRDLNLPLVMVDAKAAAQLYNLRVKESRTDTHRNELSLVRRAADWWVKQGWLVSNPFAGVVPVGQRKRGKPQLRIDEARAFITAALDDYITGGDVSGLACATTLLLGLRASECTDRIVRDLDDGGRVLWIPHGKTAAAIRQMQVPDVIRPLLLDVASSKAPLDRLWGDVDRHWLAHHTRRLCRKANVPVISPHGLRGLHATLAIGGGTSPEAVAKSLGHVNADITRAHYLAPGSEAAAQSASLVGVVTRPVFDVPNSSYSDSRALVTVGEHSFTSGDDVGTTSTSS